MKKIVSLLLAMMLLVFGAFALAEEAPTLDQALLDEMEFDPNPEYTEYTVVEYTIEAIQADLVCTISRRLLEDGTTDYYLEECT